MSATRAVQALMDQGILEESTGRRRDRVFVVASLLEAIEADSNIEN
jgi:hypothetical protein